MPVSLDLQERLEKIDQQLADLFAERIVICQNALEEDEEALSAANVASIIAYWEEVADEQGWNLALTQKLVRVLNELCKSGEE